MTDLIYFGLQPAEDGSFNHDAMTGPILEKLRDAKRRSDVSLWLTFGGWGCSSGFKKIAADPAIQTRFIAAANKLCVQADFDGIDYDWEHPKDAAEESFYPVLICETKAVFGRMECEFR